VSNTVSLCMIIKNEISNIENLMQDVCPVIEQVVVVDTGSTDGTLEKLKELKLQYPSLEIHHFDWVEHFSKARNYSFSFAKNDWVFWLDGDDRVDSTKLKEFKDNTLDSVAVDAWLLDYNYAQLPSGESLLTLGRERFIRREKNPTWIGAIHETVNISGLRQQHYHGLEIVHNRAGKTIDRGRNLRILTREYEQNPGDPRTAYYYGKELFDHIDPKGIEVLEKFVDMPSKYWDDEVNARFRLGKAYLIENKLTEAVNQAEKIYHLDHTRLRAEAYWLWGMVEVKLKNFKAAIRWFKWCLDEAPPSPRVLNKEYYTWNPRMRLVECYLSLDDIENSLLYLSELEDLLPYDQNTQNLRKRLNKLTKVRFKGPLKIIEVGGDKLRADSLVAGKDFRIGSSIEELDGIVIHNNENYNYLIDKVKPGGFVWFVAIAEVTMHEYENIGCLPTTEFNGEFIQNAIKEDPNKPTIIFQKGNDDFGPYRIRITNLKNSAIKNAYRVRSVMDFVEKSTSKADFYIGHTLTGTEEAEVKILDVCEWVPGSYQAKGIQHADAVCVCSDKLAELFKENKIHDKVFVLDDHFEYTHKEWL